MCKVSEATFLEEAVLSFYMLGGKKGGATGFNDLTKDREGYKYPMPLCFKSVKSLISLCKWKAVEENVWRWPLHV